MLTRPGEWAKKSGSVPNSSLKRIRNFSALKWNRQINFKSKQIYLSVWITFVGRLYTVNFWRLDPARLVKKMAVYNKGFIDTLSIQNLIRIAQYIYTMCLFDRISRIPKSYKNGILWFESRTASITVLIMCHRAYIASAALAYAFPVIGRTTSVT